MNNIEDFRHGGYLQFPESSDRYSLRLQIEAFRNAALISYGAMLAQNSGHEFDQAITLVGKIIFPDAPIISGGIHGKTQTD